MSHCFWDLPIKQRAASMRVLLYLSLVHLRKFDKVLYGPYGSLELYTTRKTTWIRSSDTGQIRSQMAYQGELIDSRASSFLGRLTWDLYALHSLGKLVNHHEYVLITPWCFCEGPKKSKCTLSSREPALNWIKGHFPRCAVFLFVLYDICGLNFTLHVPLLSPLCPLRVFVWCLLGAMLGCVEGRVLWTLPLACWSLFLFFLNYLPLG
jgi:hypothetical protein